MAKVLDRQSSIPLYEQLKNVLAHQIETGELRKNQQIPSERELCDTYNVSRITVRQALNLAVQEGLLTRKHGKGTFVANTPIKQELSKVNSFQSTLSQQGIIGKTEIIKAETMITDIQLAKILNINVIDQVVNLQLLGSDDDCPIVFYDSYFQLEIGKEIVTSAKNATQEGKPFSILDLYKATKIITPTHAEQTFKAVLSDETLSKQLRLKELTAIFKITSVIYSSEQPIEYRSAYYRGDKFNFYITRSME